MKWKIGEKCKLNVNELVVENFQLQLESGESDSHLKEAGYVVVV